MRTGIGHEGHLQPASGCSDLGWVHDAFLMSQVGIEQGAETPRFFLIQGGVITVTAVGNKAWRATVGPRRVTAR
jgi:hypothetical protein